MRSSGVAADRALREAFIAAGPEMLEYLERHTRRSLFQVYRHQPDYRQELPKSGARGRPLEPLPFDGRHRWGKEFDRVRWPLPELMLFGGMMVTAGGRRRVSCESGGSVDSFQLGSEVVPALCSGSAALQARDAACSGNGACGEAFFKNLLDRRVAIWVQTRRPRGSLVNTNEPCGLGRRARRVEG